MNINKVLDPDPALALVRVLVMTLVVVTDHALEGTRAGKITVETAMDAA